MVQFDRRAGVCLCFLALAAVSAPVAAKKAVQPGPVIPKETLDPSTTPPAPPPASPAPPPANPKPPPPANPKPESDGWPHTIVSGFSTSCSREPGPNEVIVYRDRGFSGKCALLKPGFYPRADNFLVGQDEISSVKVGSAVRLRAFEDTAYGGKWEIFAPRTRSAGIGDLHDEISSLRVEPAERSQNCDDLREGEIALFRNPGFQGDCVVLSGKGSYVNADTMGIANDSVSSIRNNSKRYLDCFRHTQLGEYMWRVAPHKNDVKLREGSVFSPEPDDSLSSLQMTE